MATTAPVSVPAWAWVFFAVTLAVIIVLTSYGMSRARGHSGRPTRPEKAGLTAEQRAFQEEMKLQLQLRLQERHGRASADGAASRPPGGAAPAAEARSRPEPAPPAGPDAAG